MENEVIIGVTAVMAIGMFAQIIQATTTTAEQIPITDEPLPEIPVTPIDIETLLLTAMFHDELLQLRIQFEQDYLNGNITYSRYIQLYTIFIRRSYYLDLYLRGGKWIEAASEYWELTEGITTYTEIIPIYREVYYKYLAR